MTLFSVEADVPFAETAVNDYIGTNSGRPLWTRPIGVGPSVTQEDVPFDVFAFEVSQSGEYRFDLSFNGFNGYVHLYEDSFDPTAPFDNVVLGEDGIGNTASFDADLEIGTAYYLVISGNTAADIGNFTLEISGVLDFVLQKSTYCRDYLVV